VQVSIAVGETGGNSPAEIADRERQRSQVRAIAEIEKDPFVRDLVENFDARVNEASIKPIQ
jgi:DNA polymerase III subunit gamma/tau